MNSFARTMIYGLAALCVVFIAGVVTSVAVLRSKGVLEPSVLRALVLSKQERDWLDALHTRGPEKPVARSTRGASEEEVLERIAEMANADRATRLVSDIKLQKQGLDERQTELERQWSEYRLARTDLERLQSQLEARQARIVAEKNDQAGERARWAAAQLSESNWIAQLGEAEKARYADQAKLFERFFRTSEANEQAIAGVGLGLTISRAIAEGHGGRIEVQSIRGQGTTFTVRLPGVVVGEPTVA